MTAFESMYQKMLPLKSYDTANGNIYNEIASYGYGLDDHRADLDIFLRECFISTAETYGLENREKIVGNLKSDYPTERRRNMLILRNILGENDFTKKGMEKFLFCFGITEFQLIEMPEQLTLTVYVGGDYSQVDKAWIEKQINMMVPAHLITIIDFKGISWSTADSNNLSFAELDSKNYSWKTINNLT